MKNHKKSISLILSVLMLLSVLAVGYVSADAADTATLTLGGQSYSAQIGADVTYTVNLQNANPIVNGQFYLNYPQSILEVQDVSFPVVGDFTMMYNYTENSDNVVAFNFSGTNRVDFSNGGALAIIYFKVKAAGTGALSLDKEMMSSRNDSNKLINELPNAKFTDYLTVKNPETPTNPTQPTTAAPTTAAPTTAAPTVEPTTAAPTTEPVTEPVTEPAPATTMTLKAAKSTIAYGASTTVTATVKNSTEKTVFTTSNKKIATVSSTGKVVAKGVGTVTIKASNNGVTKSVNIKVVKASNPMKVTFKKSVTANSKKNTTIKGVVTVKKAQGKVTYKTNNKKVTCSAGKLVVKKGLKKGKTVTVKITVTAKGNANYKGANKVVSVKIKVK